MASLQEEKKNLTVLSLKGVKIVSEHISLHGNEACDTSF